VQKIKCLPTLGVIVLSAVVEWFIVKSSDFNTNN